MQNNSASWRLALTFAAREWRSGIRGWRIFIICLFLGAFAFSSLTFLVSSVNSGLLESARLILDGDILITSRIREITPKEKEEISKLNTSLLPSISMRVNLFSDKKSGAILSELKAVSAGYPQVAVFEPLEALKDIDKKNDEGYWPLIGSIQLKERYNIDIGDILEIGDAKFYLKDFIVRESDGQLSGFRLGPRIIVSIKSLAETDLLLPGARITYRYALTIPDSTDVKEAENDLRNALSRDFFSIRTRNNPSPDAKEVISRVSVFALIASLSSGIIAGVGISSAISAYLNRKRKSIACWRCLGAPHKLVLRILLLQASALCLIAATPALLAGLFIPYLLSPLLQANLGINISSLPNISAVLQAIIGIVTICALFTIMPILRATNTKALAIFRDQENNPLTRKQILYFSGIISLALLLVIFTANDALLTFYVVVGFALSMLIFHLVSLALIAAIAKIAPRLKSLVRLMAITLVRQKLKTSSTVVAIGIGLSILFFVSLVRFSIEKNLNDSSRLDPPEYFLVDIQPYQKDEVTEIVTSADEVESFAPQAMVRAKIVSLKGISIKDIKISSHADWVVRGNRIVTWKSEFNEQDKNSITSGTEWSPDHKGDTLVSFSREEADNLNLKVGDKIEVSILGRTIPATISSLREVNWSSMQINFVMIFSPGVIETAPQTYMGAIKMQPDVSILPANNFLDKLSVNFRNVSVISVKEVIKEAKRLLDAIKLSLQVIGFFCIVTGLVVLAGQAAARHQSQIYENIIYKVCGGSVKQIIGMGIAYYMFLGLIALLLSVLIAVAGSWTLVTYFMQIKWGFDFVAFGWLIIVAPLIMVVTGAVSGILSLKIKPATILRNE